MPYFAYTPPRTISGNYVPSNFPLPVSSAPNPSSKVVLGGYSQAQSWRVPPFYGGMGADAAPTMLDQVTAFVSQYGLWIGAGLLGYAVLSGRMGGKRRNPHRRYRRNVQMRARRHRRR